MQPDKFSNAVAADRPHDPKATEQKAGVAAFDREANVALDASAVGSATFDRQAYADRIKMIWDVLSRNKAREP